MPEGSGPRPLEKSGGSLWPALMGGVAGAVLALLGAIYFLPKPEPDPALVAGLEQAQVSIGDLETQVQALGAVEPVDLSSVETRLDALEAGPPGDDAADALAAVESQAAANRDQLAAEIADAREGLSERIEAIEMHLATLENPRERIPWHEFTVFYRRATQLLGADALEELALRSAAESVPGIVRREEAETLHR